jgi:hypothetical protein
MEGQRRRWRAQWEGAATLAGQSWSWGECPSLWHSSRGRRPRAAVQPAVQHRPSDPPCLPRCAPPPCQVCLTAIRDLLNKTGVQPRQIKVVIVNCSLFNPTPSLSATIMNHFKMSSNTINYNLSGMGCSGARCWEQGRAGQRRARGRGRAQLGRRASALSAGAKPAPLPPGRVAPPLTRLAASSCPAPPPSPPPHAPSRRDLCGHGAPDAAALRRQLRAGGVHREHHPEPVSGRGAAPAAARSPPPEAQQPRLADSGERGAAAGTSWLAAAACAGASPPPPPSRHVSLRPAGLTLPRPTPAHPRSYFGNKKSMLIPNTIFRVGGAAMLLTNKRKDSR